MRLSAIIAVFCLSTGLSAAEDVQAAVKEHTNISPQQLASALHTLAKARDFQLVYVSEDVGDLRTSGAVGELTSEEALRRLLEGTGLSFRYVDPNTVTIVPAAGSVSATAGGSLIPHFAATFASGSEAGTDARDGGEGSNAQARGRLQAERGRESDDVEDTAEREERPIEEVIVTGTRIKGVKDQFSPVTQVTREEMELAGFNNVSDVFESLPQNFGGGVTIDTALGGSSPGPGSTSVNLRGLGNRATLILLNDHRLAAGGFLGNFVDISSIPASAIARVDVLTDGASAIYGSDAIAGVVNIILRDDFDGAETRLNVGTITDGGGDYLKAGQTLGWSGDRAHSLVTYEYSVDDELDSNEKDFAADATQPTWLLPDTEKHSVFVSTGAQLTNRITLSADGFFNDRKSKQFNSRDTTSLQHIFTETNVQQYGGALGLDLALSDDWEATLSGSYSKSDQFNNTTRGIGQGERGSAVTEILSFDGTIGGPLFKISESPVRGIIGGHYRSEKADLLQVFKSSGGVGFESDKSRNVIAAFGELYVPIISDGNRKPGVETLALSVAARYAEYDDVGSSFDPKVGLAWSPITNLNLRATYGTSFRAPRLDQLRDEVAGALLSLFVDPIAPDGESVALSVFGNRANLGPERSRTWTAGFDFAIESLEGLSLRGTYFNTVFRDQVGTPDLSFDSDGRFIEFTGVPTRDVSQETVQDLCSRAVICSNFASFFPALGDLSFEDVEVLLDSRAQNLSLSKVAGFDFEGSYDLSSDVGEWRFSLGGTLLTTFERRVAPATPIDDLLNTFGNPVDLKMRGGMQWRTTAMTAAVFINYVGDYIDDEVPTGTVAIDSFTTVDATIRLDLGELVGSPLMEGTTLSFNAINMLNEDPPMIGAAPLRAATFDRANANPAGRKMGLLLTKKW